MYYDFYPVKGVDHRSQPPRTIEVVGAEIVKAHDRAIKLGGKVVASYQVDAARDAYRHKESIVSRGDIGGDLVTYDRAYTGESYTLLVGEFKGTKDSHSSAVGEWYEAESDVSSS